MHANLVMVTALFCAFFGALLALTSHVTLRGTANRLVVAYPRVLTRAQAGRLDRRFGFFLLGCAAAFYALASRGYAAPLSLWRYPVAAAAVLSCAYLVMRLLIVYRRGGRTGAPRQLYETARSRTLREAAMAESAALRAREIARDPRDRGIVFLARDWDRRWWASRLGVSSDALRAAIRQVGPMVKDIERHLGVQRRDTLSA